LSKLKNSRNQTTYFENEKQWLCNNCFTINPNTWNECDDCGRIKGVFQIIRKPVKKMTWKEWKKFKWFKKEQVNGEIFYMDMQMLFIQKYDVRLTDYLPKWKRRYRTLRKYVNMTNVNKGINTFNKGVQQFTKAVDSTTSELGGGIKHTRSKKDKENIKLLIGEKNQSRKKTNTSIWGKKKRQKKNTIQIWREEKEPKRKKYQRKPDKDRDNMKKIWG